MCSLAHHRCQWNGCKDTEKIEQTATFSFSSIFNSLLTHNFFYWILNGSCVWYYAKAVHNELFDFFEKYWTYSETHGKRLIQRSKLKTKRIVQIWNRHKFILKKWDYRSWLKSLHKTKTPHCECKWNFTNWAEVFFSAPLLVQIIYHRKTQSDSNKESHFMAWSCDFNFSKIDFYLHFLDRWFLLIFSLFRRVF